DEFSMAAPPSPVMSRPPSYRVTRPAVPLRCWPAGVTLIAARSNAPIMSGVNRGMRFDLLGFAPNRRSGLQAFAATIPAGILAGLWKSTALVSHGRCRVWGHCNPTQLAWIQPVQLAPFAAVDDDVAGAAVDVAEHRLSTLRAVNQPLAGI